MEPLSIDRFDTRGNLVEQVEITTGRLDKVVYLQIQGQRGAMKNFAMSIDQWRKLNAEAEKER